MKASAKKNNNLIIEICRSNTCIVVFRPNDNETSNCSPTQQTNTDSNNQQGKRKFSISQYQEHKRLKSTESPVNYAGDVDMRILPNETNRVR